jgi:predicted DsbA family dithiol-disulfide isomerase
MVDSERELNDPAVKQKLRRNTEWAIEQGVFGVPTFVIGAEIFWGHDALDMVIDYIRDPRQFEAADLQRIKSLPVGAVRAHKH